MAKIKDLNTAMERYKGKGSNEFFGLENDKDSAIVRFLHGSELTAEEDWFVVHQVEIEGKKRWVQCTEEKDCPICLAGNRPQLKLFLQLYDTRDGKVKTWERGQTFVPKVVGLMNKYGNLFERQFEIQRYGRKGDTKTTYEIYPLDKDGKRLTDFPERQMLLGENGFVLKKSYSELKEIATGTYKVGEASEPTPQPRARSSNDIF